MPNDPITYTRLWTALDEALEPLDYERTGSSRYTGPVPDNAPIWQALDVAITRLRELRALEAAAPRGEE